MPHRRLAVHFEEFRETSSSSRSRSAFTLSSSNRSILVWTTSGSERPCPTYRLVHERIGLSGLFGDGVDGPFEDVAFAPGHAAIVRRMADPLGKRDGLPRGRAGGAIPRSSRMVGGYAAALHPSIDGVAPLPAPRSLGSPHSSSISRSTE